jgi:putative DNA primase/helicase
MNPRDTVNSTDIHWGSATRRRPPTAVGPAVDVALDFSHTDSGNAEMFHALYGPRVCYDYSREGWFFYHGHRWQPNVTAEVDRFALEAIRTRQAMALQETDDARRKHALRWAMDSENRSRRENLLACAAKIQGIAVDGNHWDGNRLLFGAANGVVELETGRRRDGTPADWMTKVAPVAYEPTAICPRFEQFLGELFEDRPELVDYLQRAFGYGLTGMTTEQAFWIFFGLGANGKSTLLETLFHHVFGSAHYGWTMPFPAAGWSSSMSEYQKASLVGRRFVSTSEVTRRGHINEELVKSLTGDDTINARHPYGRPFQFVPVAKFFVRVNDKPIIRDETHGMWRRVKLIEFTRTFPVDTSLASTLAAEAPGILAWCVRGCLEWQRDGLREPACVQAATAEYREESDPLHEFLRDRCVTHARARVGGLELFTAYRQWCDARQATIDERLSQKAFGLHVKGRFPDVGTKRKTIYSGLGLQSDNPLNFEQEPEPEVERLAPVALVSTHQQDFL